MQFNQAYANSCLSLVQVDFSGFPVAARDTALSDLESGEVQGIGLLKAAKDYS